jgi:hypothetical protein
MRRGVVVAGNVELAANWLISLVEMNPVGDTRMISNDADLTVRNVEHAPEILHADRKVLLSDLDGIVAADLLDGRGVIADDVAVAGDGDVMSEKFSLFGS